MTREILLEARGRATGVAYYDANDRLETQTADLVIVSCGAVESARLLLNTRHKLFPSGLGNRYDWVGRNLRGELGGGGPAVHVSNVNGRIEIRHANDNRPLSPAKNKNDDRDDNDDGNTI